MLMVARGDEHVNKNNRKGFTLAELLIVVAIIAVLVAISIPIFNNQRRKARLAVNQANAKAAEEMAMTAYLTEGKDTTAYFCVDGTGTKDGYVPIAGTGFSYKYDGSHRTYVGPNNYIKECASSALRIQAGESPAPVKPSKQPVHSLEAKAAR